MNRVQADSTWADLRRQACAWRTQEPLLGAWLDHLVLGQGSLAASLAQLLADKLADGPGTDGIDRAALCDTLHSVFDDAPATLAATRRDLAAVPERDPSTDEILTVFLFQKGFQALQAHRAAHRLWRAGRYALAALLQSRASEVFAVDIHPAARIGAGVFIDHATGVVIGATAVVGDDVSMLQEVTLGGTGKEKGDRHPKIGNGVLLCAGAKVLGNIAIGEGARVGAGSVVLDAVKPFTTVVGVPACAVRAFEPPARRSLDAVSLDAVSLDARSDPRSLDALAFNAMSSAPIAIR